MSRIVIDPPAKPTKTVIEGEGFVIPAGQGCAFAVEEQVPEGTTVVIKEFSDGRIVTHGNADPTLVNLETGDTFAQRTRATVTDTFDPQTNEIVEEISGRIFIGLVETKAPLEKSERMACWPA